MEKKTVPVSFMLLGILFNVCLITSNFLETKLINFFGLPLTAGLIVFPISYIINDLIAEVWGFTKARIVIWSGFISNFLVIGFCQIAVMLPGASFWEGQEHFNFVFGLAPRIVVASMIAFLLGSFINAYIMSKMKIQSQGKNFSLRAVVSTLGGETADSLIFFPIAFGGLMPLSELLKLMLLQVILKSAYEIIVLPITIRVVKFIKKIEQTDVYDRNISYKIVDLKDIN